MKTRVTVESLTEEFNEAIAIARETRNAGAVTQAALAKGKLHGLIVDRKESGAPGDFAQLESIDAIVAKVRSELGDDAAAALAKLIPQASQAVEPSGLEQIERGDDALN